MIPGNLGSTVHVPKKTAESNFTRGLTFVLQATNRPILNPLKRRNDIPSNQTTPYMFVLPV
jgi:hypothetical protein